MPEVQANRRKLLNYVLDELDKFDSASFSYWWENHVVCNFCLLEPMCPYCLEHDYEPDIFANDLPAYVNRCNQVIKDFIQTGEIVDAREEERDIHE